MANGGGGCDAVCQKLLLCAGCGGFGLQVQDDAQKTWLKDGHTLSQDFLGRQEDRTVRIRVLIQECYEKINPTTNIVLATTDLGFLGQELVHLSRRRGLPDDVARYCIARADECEHLISDNQSDYLDEIGYVAA